MRLRTAAALARILLAGVTLVLLAFGAAAADSAAPPPGLSIQARAGFDGFYKVGGWLPVAVLAANTGPPIDGQLSLDPAGPVSLSASYSAHAELPTQSQKLLTFATPAVSSERTRTLTLRAAGKTLAAVPLDLTPLSPRDYLYGVVSPDAGALDALRGGRQFGGSVNVAHLSLNDLPTSGGALSTLDALVLDATPTANVPPELVRALTGWVASGGQLILTGGPGAAQTLAGLGGLAPVRLAGTATLDPSTAIADWAGGAQLATGATVAATATPLPGSILRLRAGDTALVVDRAFGDGWVTFVALPASAPVLETGPGAVAFWQRVLTGSRHPLLGVQAGPESQGYPVASAVYALPQVSLPSGSLLAWLLFAYILAVGPVSYLVLRRLDRRELLWVTIPVVSLLFSSGAYALARQAKGSDVIVNTVTTVRSVGGAAGGVASGQIGLFSPARTTYTVRVGGGAAVAPLDLMAGSAAADGPAIVADGGSAVLEGVHVDTWAMQAFDVSSFAAAPPPLAASLTVSGNALVGWVRNDGSQPLDDVQVIVGGNHTALPRLAPGQQQPVRLALTSSVSAFRQPPVPPTGPTTAESRRRQDLLDEALGQNFGYPKVATSGDALTGPVVAAFSAADVFPVTVAGKRGQEHDLRLDVVSVPVTLGPGQTALPYGLAPRVLLENSGYASNGEPGPLALGTTATFQFRLPPPAAGASWQTLHWRLLLSGPNQALGAAPSFAAYNWTTGGWDALGAGPGGVYTASQAGRYVDERGLARVRLTGGNGSAYLQALDVAADGAAR